MKKAYFNNVSEMENYLNVVSGCETVLFTGGGAEAMYDVDSKIPGLLLLSSKEDDYNGEDNFVTLSLVGKKSKPGYYFLITKHLKGRRPENATRYTAGAARDIYEKFVNETTSFGRLACFIEENFSDEIRINEDGELLVIPHEEILFAEKGRKLIDECWELYYSLLSDCIKEAAKRLLSIENGERILLWRIKNAMNLPGLIACPKEDGADWILCFNEDKNGESVAYVIEDFNCDLMNGLIEDVIANSCGDCDCYENCEGCNAPQEGDIFIDETEKGTVVVLIKNGAYCAFNKEQIRMLRMYRDGMRFIEELESLIDPKDIPAEGLLSREFLEALRNTYMLYRFNGMRALDAVGQALRETTYKATGKYYGNAPGCMLKNVTFPKPDSVTLRFGFEEEIPLTKEEITAILNVADSGM